MDLRTFFELLFPPQCAVCAQPGTGLCESCVKPAPPVPVRLSTIDVLALGEYAGGLRRAIVALKSGRRDVARSLADRLTAIVPLRSTLVPVPTTSARRRERGFDGCEFLARAIAATGAASAFPGLRQTRGDRQRGRDRAARLAAAGRFVWRGSDLRGRTIVLLDDVVTTGATLEDCASALRASGALVKQAIVIAKA